MEEDIRKPVVYLDLAHSGNKESTLKRLTVLSRGEASTLEERLAFWMDLIDR
jgi:hypothetical protein